MRRVALLPAVLVVSAVAFCRSAVGSNVVPSLEITGSTSGICDNTGGSLNPNIPTFVNVRAGSSDAATMSVAGVGVVDNQKENQPFNASFAGTFGFVPSTYTVPPGTLVTVEIITYFGSNQTGGVSFRSKIVFACDTGQIVSLVSGAPIASPTLSTAGLAVLGLCLVAAGVGRLSPARVSHSAS